jgi:hypothetical protein
MEPTLETQVAVLATKVEQLSVRLEECALTQKELVNQIQKLDQALAVQKPWTTLVQHIVTALVTGVAAIIWAKGQHNQ